MPARGGPCSGYYFWMPWIKCSDELPPYNDEVTLWLIPNEPKGAHAVKGTRLHFGDGMFLAEDDPFRPLSWISHWSRDAEKIKPRP